MRERVGVVCQVCCTSLTTWCLAMMPKPASIESQRGYSDLDYWAVCVLELLGYQAFEVEECTRLCDAAGLEM